MDYMDYILQISNNSATWAFWCQPPVSHYVPSYAAVALTFFQALKSIQVTFLHMCELVSVIS